MKKLKTLIIAGLFFSCVISSCKGGGRKSSGMSAAKALAKKMMVQYNKVNASLKSAKTAAELKKSMEGLIVVIKTNVAENQKFMKKYPKFNPHKNPELRKINQKGHKLVRDIMLLIKKRIAEFKDNKAFKTYADDYLKNFQLRVRSSK